MAKKRTISAHKKTVWNKFSKWTRQRHADHAGYTECVTCNEWQPWKEMQAGHGIHCGSRGKELIRFHPQNVHSQCGVCNTGQRMNSKYADFMYAEYGPKIFIELGKLEYALHSWTHEELAHIEEILKWPNIGDAEEYLIEYLVQLKG